MDDPSPGPVNDPSGCLSWGCLIVVVVFAVLAILGATGVCAAA
ncbi:MAG: hypothetical protein OXG33_08740 [Chloroflexi bacterium]|nr:hypothetical protein [Chloroflexota bacterium]